MVGGPLLVLGMHGRQIFRASDLDFCTAVAVLLGGPAFGETRTGETRTDGEKPGQTEMTLKRTRLSEMLIDGLLRLEHQRTLRCLCSGLSGPSALLRGQVAVHFVFERADKFSRP
jgi:hypothetical protein